MINSVDELTVIDTLMCLICNEFVYISVFYKNRVHQYGYSVWSGQMQTNILKIIDFYLKYLSWNSILTDIAFLCVKSLKFIV